MVCFLDSRFRGNDKIGCEGLVPAMSLECLRITGKLCFARATRHTEVQEETSCWGVTGCSVES